MATTDVVVSVRLVKRLEGFVKSTDRGVFGLLFGVNHDGKQFILSSAMGTKGQPSELPESIQNFYDVVEGLTLQGLWFKMDQGHLPAVVKQVWEKICPTEVMKKLFDKGECILWPVGEIQVKENQMRVKDADKGPHLYHYTLHEGAMHELPSSTTDEDLMASAMLVRLRSQITVGFELSQKKGELRKNIDHAIGLMQNKVKSPLALFHIQKSSVLLSVGSKAVGCVDPSMTCGEIPKYVNDDDAPPERKKGKKKEKPQTVLHASLLFLSSGEGAAEYGISCAPVIHHEHRTFQHASVPLCLDVVVAVFEETTAEHLTHCLVEGVYKQLEVMAACLSEYAEGENLHVPRVHHFKPTCADHLHTLVYPAGVSDESLQAYRRALHHLLVLPADRPLLTRSIKYTFPDDPPTDGYLRNTHIGLPQSKVEGGRVYLVDGTYTYHHYMQDRFDDDKWGCAYRSLQTIVSWLRQQGYTTKAIPTHRDIQQALVDIGDKERKFIGSKQWIGSTEVGYVLDHLYGVSSKILFVSSGAEMSSKGRELALHFEKQGSPIMIGGGVLAHTILGVDFNEVTGSVKFLILDPHYTGAEDLGIIQDKGWCGWKGPDFWDQHAYYNLCMPQRPAMI